MFDSSFLYAGRITCRNFSNNVHLLSWKTDRYELSQGNILVSCVTVVLGLGVQSGDLKSPLPGFWLCHLDIPLLTVAKSLWGKSWLSWSQLKFGKWIQWNQDFTFYLQDWLPFCRLLEKEYVFLWGEIWTAVVHINECEVVSSCFHNPFNMGKNLQYETYLWLSQVRSMLWRSLDFLH